MADSVEEQCLQVIEARYAALTLTDRGDGRGARSISKVTRNSEGLEQIDIFPIIDIDTQAETSEILVNYSQNKTIKPLTITIIDEREEDPDETYTMDKLAASLESDLVRGMFNTLGGDPDASLNNLALIVNKMSGRRYSSKVHSPRVAVEVRFNLEIVSSYSDPTAVV